jgi:outer membrane protein
MSTQPRRPWLAAVSVLALVGAATAARAETLADALALAYESNPTLQSQRALQRQTDETYVQARAGWRPTLNATAVAQYQNQVSPVDSRTIVQDRATGTVTASQPIFTSGRVSAQVEAADATVRAGRETLRATEATILQQVVQSYQDVLRDQQIVALRQQSVDVLTRQLSETQARFEVGLITRTDVARAEAQLAQSRAQLSLARSALQNSRANYAATIGRTPENLETPPVLPGLPNSIDDALTAAEQLNPNLRRAIINEEASRARVAQIKAQRGPTVSVQTSYGYTTDVTQFGSPFARNINASANVSIPIFTGGVLSSQIRAALEQNTSDRILIEQQRRTVIQTLSVAWSQMLGAHASILSNREQVRSATVAFEGSQEQFRVGLATTLDVLLAQEQLRLAQLALVQSQRDEYVAQSQVLAAAGRLELGALATNAPNYDPSAHFDEVKNKGALPWESLIRAIDLDKGADDVTPGAAPASTDPNGPTVLNAGAQPSVLDAAEAALIQSSPSPAVLPQAGALPNSSAGVAAPR